MANNPKGYKITHIVYTVNKFKGRIELCGTLIEGPQGGMHYLCMVNSQHLFLSMVKATLYISGIRYEELNKMGIHDVDFDKVCNRLVRNNGIKVMFIPDRKYHDETINEIQRALGKSFNEHSVTDSFISKIFVKLRYVLTLDDVRESLIKG